MAERTKRRRATREKAIRGHYVRFEEGDIEGISVMHFETHTRLAVYERGEALPLLHAELSDLERLDLALALDQCMPKFEPDPEFGGVP